MRVPSLIFIVVVWYCSVLGQAAPPTGRYSFSTWNLPATSFIRTVIESRADVRATYLQLRTKGQNLYSDLTCGVYTPRPRLTRADLESLGWRIGEGDNYTPSFALVRTLQALQLPTDGQYIKKTPGNWQSFGRLEFETSKYHAAYGPASGVIIVEVADREGSPVHWSDATCLMWYEACQQKNQRTDGLKYVVHKDVANLATISVWMQHNRGQYPSDTQTYLPTGNTQDTFYALLGSPNGIGTARFLLDHAEDLGDAKAVTSISMQRVFVNGREFFHMWLIIGDVPEATGATEATPKQCCRIQ